jgi:hypothetical protein
MDQAKVEKDTIWESWNMKKTIIENGDKLQ